ncbi:MAG: VirB4 family type IV secretion system protein [Vicinamibacterales bacterium]
MVKLSRIVRDYTDAGGVNTLLAPWGFVQDGIFLTKGGDVGLAYAVRGVDIDGLTHAERRAVAHRMEAALRVLDERTRVYQYLVKRFADRFVAPSCPEPIAQEAASRRAAYLNERRTTLCRLDPFLVLVHEPSRHGKTATSLAHIFRHPKHALRSWLSTAHTLQVVDAELTSAVDALLHKAGTFEAQLAGGGLERLNRAGTFRLLRRLVNYDAEVIDATVANTPEIHVDYFIGDSAVECHRDHLLVGRQAVKVLTMKEPPSQTFAHLLGDLFSVPGEFIACLEWQRVPQDRMRRDIQTRRRHFFNQRVSLVNYITPDAKPEEMLVDESASATVKQLGDALTEIEVNGHTFGQCSLTLVLHHEDRRVLQQHAADAAKTLAVHDGAFYDETYNLLNAWLSIVPGNGAHNLRRVALLETHVADLSLLFTVDPGTVDSGLLRAPLAVLETPHHTPFDLHLHVQDVGHTLVLGATGSGKSFLLNFLTTSAQQYDPFTIVLDLGHSYRKLAALLHGRYLELGLRQREVTINPFALEQTPEHLHFLHAFVRVLLEGEDGYRLSEAEDREVYEAVENVYALQRGQRRLFTVANLLPRGLAARLQKWVEGGRYAELFDHVEDTLTFDRLQVFDFEAMRAFPSLIEPLLFYILHRVNERVHTGEQAATLKLCVMDEAWRFIQNPTLRAYVQEALKTWRKRNAAMLLATQTVEDFASVDLLRTVVESCPTKLFLANPALDRVKYGDLFQLNDMELDLLAGLAPRGQLLLKRPHLTKVLTLSVDPKSYWIYTNTPIDNDRVAAVFKEHGFEAGLDRLAASA